MIDLGESIQSIVDDSVSDSLEYSIREAVGDEVYGSTQGPLWYPISNLLYASAWPSIEASIRRELNA